jgi:hypothetical protein
MAPSEGMAVRDVEDDVTYAKWIEESPLRDLLRRIDRHRKDAGLIITREEFQSLQEQHPQAVDLEQNPDVLRGYLSYNGKELLGYIWGVTLVAEPKPLRGPSRFISHLDDLISVWP